MENTVSVESFLSSLQQHNPHQPEFLQAVREVFTSLWPFIERNPRYREYALLERLVEPERTSSPPPSGLIKAACAFILRSICRF